MATPAVTTNARLSAADLVSVAVTGATNSTPYGYTTAAQANAIVTTLNAVVALLKAGGETHPA